MTSVIDLGEEILIDRSTVRAPECLLLLAALGKPLMRGSAWLVVRKDVSDHYALPVHLGAGPQDIAC